MTKTKLEICGPPGTQEVILGPKGAVLGRDLGCDVTLDHYNVSRVHARISQDPFGRWIVEDMDSQNGILVSGQRIRSQALQYGQTFSIHPFDLTLLLETESQTSLGHSSQETIHIVDSRMDGNISVYHSDATVMFSSTLVHYLNELNARLLQLSGPPDLYAEASSCLAGMLDALVAIVRLPSDAQPLPESPDVLTVHLGASEKDVGRTDNPCIHFSKRVLDATRQTPSPVMAGSVHASAEDLRLTVIDELRPHRVFSAQVNQLEDSVDVLYIDIPEGQSPDHMFDFVEAVARQINFAQKSLFLAELEKQEKALREANAQLKQKDRIKDEYVSRVTHDIKGHLAAIQNCLYAVVETSGGTLAERPVDFLNRAMNRTKELTAFVRKLLHLTQMKLSGRFDVEPFSMSRVLQNALTTVESSAQDKSITLTSEIDDPLGSLVGDAFSVTEMITNLLYNAVKYTPSGNAVHLRAGNRGEHVQIEIVDTGMGIPADELVYIFDEFYRASNVAKRKQEGNGLGLSIVRQIVESHGGSVSVQSEEGQGSTFTVLLPKSV